METIWNKTPEKCLEQFDLMSDHPSHSYVRGVIKDERFRNMLECGIGNGSTALFVKENKMFLKYTGLDTTEEFIKYAEEKYGTKVKIKFKHGDIQDIPFGDGEFDLVYTRHTLEYLPNYKKAVAELARVCSNRCIIVLLNDLKPRGNKIKFNNEKGVYFNYYKESGLIGTLRSLFEKVSIYKTPETDKFNKNIILDCYKEE